ncbi:hypothetical protein G4B84_004252, partial [Aspergillus flavus NRRL3357]
YTKRDNSTMAKDDNDGNGSLIVGMIILGAAVCVMIYCGIRQMLEDLPRYVVRDRTPEQISYMRDIFSLGTQAVILYGFEHAGYGYHISQLPLSVLSRFRKCMLAAPVIYVPALAFAKLALLMLYYRLLQATHTLYVYVIYAVGFIIAGYSLALPLALIFGCSPIQKSWDITITTGSCINTAGVYLATAITNTISDVILLLLPIPVVWGLRLPVIQKVGVLCMFGVGFLTTSISIVRLATLMPLVTSQDQTRDIALAAIFIDIEANTIIICGSFPYLRQFLRYHAPRWMDYSLSSRRKSSSTESPSAQMRKPGLTQLQDDIERAINNTDGMTSVEGNLERGPREVL